MSKQNAQQVASHNFAKSDMYPAEFTDLLTAVRSTDSPAMQNVLLQTEFIAQNGFAMSTAQRKKLQLSLGFPPSECK
tara:strand:- start:705 stop:935 length:231 start_codon:yes stop_codon:yes gene_type:complete